MMFPVAESLGDLIYRKDDATAQNPRSVLEHEFGRFVADIEGTSEGGCPGKAPALSVNPGANTEAEPPGTKVGFSSTANGN
jgi:hypothetical protein